MSRSPGFVPRRRGRIWVRPTLIYYWNFRTKPRQTKFAPKLSVGDWYRKFQGPGQADQDEQDPAIE
eukprot:scaffold193223_cov24-Attheya_sp.AAC.1